jgi:hypothetical protein
VDVKDWKVIESELIRRKTELKFKKKEREGA